MSGFDKPYTKLIISKINLSFTPHLSSEDGTQKAGWVTEKSIRFEHLSEDLQKQIKAEISEGLLPYYKEQYETLEEVIFEDRADDS